MNYSKSTTAPPSPEKSESRILILAPIGKDGPLLADAMHAKGFQSVVCATMAQLLDEARVPPAVLIMTEEALRSAGHVAALLAHLAEQPSWSDLPLVVACSTPRARSLDSARALAALDGPANITLLERPFSPLALVNAVKTALRARHLQYARRQLLQELETARRAAEAASMAKSAFLANTSHEIRTPLGAILGFNDMLRDRSLPEAERVEFIETIERNGRSLMQLLNDILDLSKVEAGKLDVECAPFSLHGLLGDVMAMLSVAARSKNLELKLEHLDEVPEVIESDRGRLRQILINVINNAIKFTDAGSVSIAAAYEPLPADNRALVSFSVTDTGRGIKSEESGRLFRPFSQADNSTAREFGGTGLGLLLAKRLAGCLGGDVTLESSKPGEGSCFLIKVNVGQSQLVPHASTEAALRTLWNQTHFKDAFRDLSILVVDDAADNRKLMEYYLRATGAVVDTACDGAAAINCATSKTYDVILMDLQMPQVDGFQATTKLRELGLTLPIIALTAHAMRGDRQKSLDFGFQDHLTKPLRPEILIAALARTVGRSL